MMSLIFQSSSTYSSSYIFIRLIIKSCSTWNRNCIVCQEDFPQWCFSSAIYTPLKLATKNATLSPALSTYGELIYYLTRISKSHTNARLLSVHTFMLFNFDLVLKNVSRPIQALFVSWISVKYHVALQTNVWHLIFITWSAGKNLNKFPKICIRLRCFVKEMARRP